MIISLFYMSKVTFGGFVSYTSHLCRAFRAMGHDCRIYKVRKRTEHKMRDFSDGVGATNVSIQDALSIIDSSDYSIVTASFWRGWSDPISKLIERGAEVVIHDHTDYTREFKEFMLAYDVHPIVIRKINEANLQENGLQPMYIPHPYVAVNPKPVCRTVHAISVCRLDYDKNTHMLIEANQYLPKDKCIQLWGSHTRMYMYQKIVGKYEGWTDDKHYTGPNYPLDHQRFPKTLGSAVALNSQAEFSCDMSAIKGDGGGTQYSFLEAIDGGAVLVLNKRWLTGRDSDELAHGYNCLTVVDTEGLIDLLLYERRDGWLDVVENAYGILKAHSPGVIVPMYMRFLRGDL